MPSGIYNSNFSAGGVSIQSGKTFSGDGASGVETTLPVGKAGTLSTRTSDTAGTVTATAHGLIVGDIIDIHWPTGVRYGVRVDTVPDANSITFDDIPAAGGDVLPAQDTAVVVTKQVAINVPFDAQELIAIGIMGKVADGQTGKGHIAFYSAAAAEVAEFDLNGNVMVFEEGTDSSFATDVATAKASNGSATVEMTLQIAILEDATP